MKDGHPLLLRADQVQAGLHTFRHPWNPNSEITGARLGRMLGLRRTGVNFTTVPPGKESFVYHAHHLEEEWIYILSGRGVAEIDGEVFEVGAGDFMAFPATGVAHHLVNAGDQDLVYLCGGEHREAEIVDFPRLGKRSVRTGDTVEVFDRPGTPPPGSPASDAGTAR
ncbi:cupin [Cupriavidus sp. USMAA2-4]|uniref:Cupin n=1 Tax=Cupriavidus malaysiensis TaxID=367825 RepID=A0ABM6F9K1_9BURK|nr:MULTISPECIES: cupin domain-containing protein [Cupriavidus]AOY95173.1 cupin [Cupriavidus sp. USMAA2-4]AOZ01928.1 cupin [Cupriavidus sp. USMAHM13]AOZ08334.1 cupin [Cupriavidus malaysiensis]